MGIAASLRHLTDFCYPPICGLYDSVGGKIQVICDECRFKIELLESAPACEKCAMPLSSAGAPCPYCLGKGIRPFDSIIRLANFDEPITQLIYHIKYHRRWTLAELAADRLRQQPRVRELLSQADRIISVPLHPMRQFGRGYNQAEVIARRLCRRTRMRYVRPLVRLRNTETQTHLNSKERRFENMREAFGLLWPKQVAKKHVVIVDDVMTSGATLMAAANALRDAEPLSIHAIVVARADPRGRGFETI